MAHEISVTLRADPAPYDAAIGRMKQATTDWELAVASGADDVSEKFEDVIRAFVDMGRQGGRSADEIKRQLQTLGLSADDAVDAEFKAYCEANGIDLTV